MNEYNTPTISVLMPFRNTAPFLDAALSCILNQTYPYFELIVINDASEDDSDEIVKKYQHDRRLRYIKNKERRGVAQNLNQGIALARGEYVARMDGDDVCDLARFEKQYDFLKSHPEIDVVGTFLNIIDEHGTIIDRRTKPVTPEEIAHALIVYGSVTLGTAMISKKSLDAIGGYRTDQLNGEDIDLLYRLVYSGYRAANIPEFLYSYRYHDGSTAHQARENALTDFRLRREAIQRFSLSLPITQRLLMYAQLIIGVSVSGRTRQRLEGFYKKIVYGKK